MKRILSTIAGLFVVALALFGCSSNAPFPFNQHPFGAMPFGSDKEPWVTLIDGEKDWRISPALVTRTGSPCTARFKATA